MEVARFFFLGGGGNWVRNSLDVPLVIKNKPPNSIRNGWNPSKLDQNLKSMSLL